MASAGTRGNLRAQPCSQFHHWEDAACPRCAHPEHHPHADWNSQAIETLWNVIWKLVLHQRGRCWICQGPGCILGAIQKHIFPAHHMLSLHAPLLLLLLSFFLHSFRPPAYSVFSFLPSQAQSPVPLLSHAAGSAAPVQGNSPWVSRKPLPREGEGKLSAAGREGSCDTGDDEHQGPKTTETRIQSWAAKNLCRELGTNLGSYPAHREEGFLLLQRFTVPAAIKNTHTGLTVHRDLTAHASPATRCHCCRCPHQEGAGWGPSACTLQRFAGQLLLSQSPVTEPEAAMCWASAPPLLTHRCHAPRWVMRAGISTFPRSQL